MFSTLIIIIIQRNEYQISILERFQKNHMTRKTVTTALMAAENSALPLQT